MKDKRVRRQQAQRKKLLMEKQTIEQRIRHEREKKERKGQESCEEEEESERREVVPKKSFVSKMKTRHLEHQREQIIKAIARTYEKKEAIDVGGNKPNLSTLYFTLAHAASCFTIIYS